LLVQEPTAPESELFSQQSSNPDSLNLLKGNDVSRTAVEIGGSE